MAGLVVLFLFVQTVLWGGFGHLPDVAELKNIQNSNTSQVISSDKKIIGKYYDENRTDIDFKDIPKSVINALVSTEDARFFEHGGVDVRSLFRVLIKTVLLQKANSGGGSTLSQQLAKNLYGRKKYRFLSMLIIKTREMIIAKRLESIYTKDELLTLYLNTVPFSGNVYGVKVASNVYFGKDPAQLKTEEAAVLIGMLKANTTFDPSLYPDRSKARRNVVLKQMNKYDFVDTGEYEELIKKPLVITKNKRTNKHKMSDYYIEHIRPEVEEILEEYATDYGEIYDLKTDGLKIYTTIDSRLQFYAEKSVEEHLTYLQKLLDKQNPTALLKDSNGLVQKAMKDSPRYKSMKSNGASKNDIKKSFNTKVPMTVFKWGDKVEKVTISPMDSIKYYLALLNTGFLVAEPQTGHLKAWVGGVNYSKLPYDHVLSKRQTGSVFKPFVYAAALENDSMDICSYVPNLLTTYTEFDDWQPRNSNDEYGGYYSLQGGLTHSVNTVAVDLIMQMDLDSVVQFTNDLGIETEIEAYPSIALGTASLSVGEMVKAYIPFANKGRKNDLVSLIRIETAQGKVIYENEAEPQNEQIIEERTAKVMTHFLKSVVDNGTAKRLRTLYKFTDDMAGKTGTTQSHADGWFMGYTSSLVGGCWVGSASPDVHFNSITYGQGAVMALPIWARFYQKVKADNGLKQYQNSYFDGFSLEEMDEIDCPLFLEKLPIRDSIEIKEIDKKATLDKVIDFFKKNKETKLPENKTKKEETKKKRETRKEKNKRKRKEKRKKFWRGIFG